MRDKALETVESFCEKDPSYDDAWWRDILIEKYVEYLYDNNMEIVDRTLSEEEARHLDEEIGRSMQFDNPLSGGGK